MKNGLYKLTEIEKLHCNTSINIMYMGDIHQFVFDENMQMRTSIECLPENKEKVLALLMDAVEEMASSA
jgi:hypothetical protein